MGRQVGTRRAVGRSLLLSLPYSVSGEPEGWLCQGGTHTGKCQHVTLISIRDAHDYASVIELD